MQSRYYVLNLNENKENILKRIVGRIICQACGASFNVNTRQPKSEGVCDYCPGKLIKRKDDALDVFENRWKVYTIETKPLLDYYREKRILIEVIPDQDVQVTFIQLKLIINAIIKSGSTVSSAVEIYSDENWVNSWHLGRRIMAKELDFDEIVKYLWKLRDIEGGVFSYDSSVVKYKSS